MKQLSKLQVRTKIILSFLVVALLCGTMGVYGIFSLKSIEKSDAELYENMTVPLSQIGELSTEFNRARVDIRDAIIAQSPEDIQTKIASIEERRNRIDELTADFEKTILSDKMRDEYNKLVDAKKIYRQEFDKVIELAKQNKDAEAIYLLSSDGAAGKASKNEQDIIENIVSMKIQDAGTKSETNIITADRTIKITIGLLACIMILFILVGAYASALIAKTLRRAVNIMNNVSDGNIKALTALDNVNDEITPALKKTIEILGRLDVEIQTLIKAIIDGKLDVRGDEDSFTGNWKSLIGGINGLTNAFVSPINVTAAYIDKISKGEIPPKITDTYNGDFNEIKNNLNNCIETMSGLLSETEKLIKATQEGKLDTRGNAGAFSGEWGTLIGEVNNLIDAFVGPINVTAEYVDRISKGDIPPRITDIYLGDFNEIKNNLNNCIDVMGGLLNETNTLIVATQEGKLETRGNSEAFAGDWGSLVKGINSLIEAFVAPINVTADYIDKIGKGEIPPEITDTYQGDFNEIKNNINACIKGLGGLVEGRNILSRMSNNDYTKQVEGSYSGIYCDIAESVNKVSDRVNHTIEILNNIAVGNLKDLEGLKAIGRRCENDKLMPAMIIMIENIKALVEETSILSTASVEGRLNTRGDASKFKGEFGKVILGINETLDAVIEPINEASSVLKEMASGNLDVLVTGTYKGDHAEIKNALNETIVNMNQVMSEINQAADQVATGSRQVSEGSQTLSQGSTEQASSIEELNASIMDIASQTKQNASNANTASELAMEAKDKAVQGNIRMKEMLNSMADINESSANISKIIKVIDDIAFQTNILALNAAVEAARAGQHGKGFAVVAEEVRSLAARSAEAAKNTTDLIEGSVNKVQQGTKIANDTAAALSEIVTGIEKSANLVVDIATASNEQATGIAQINRGIEQVSQVVQNNSATAEESAAASEELSGQALLLKEMVTRFKLNKEGISMGELKLLQSGTFEGSSSKPQKISMSRIILNGEESDKY